MEIENNIEKMNNYIKKQSLLGDELLRFEATGKYNGCITMFRGKSERWMSDSIELVIPSFVNFINVAEFKDINSIKSIAFEKDSDLLVIGGNAFENCKELEKIDFSNCRNIIQISKEAFQRCLNLKEIKFSDIDFIGKSAFSRTNIENLRIRAEEIRIGDCAFYGCYNLKEIDIEAIELTLGEMAFHECESLKIRNIHENKSI